MRVVLFVAALALLLICGAYAQSMDMTVDEMMKAYNLTNEQITTFNNQGFNNSEIATAAIISKKAGIGIEDVLQQYCKTKDWNKVLKYYGLNDECEPCGISVQENKCGETPQCTQKNPCDAGCAPAFCSPCQSATQMGSGPNNCGPVYYYNSAGNIFLTSYEVQRYYNAGYDWLDVAIAANVEIYSGYPITLVLQQLKIGYQWDYIIKKFGVSPQNAYNVSCYPFERVRTYSESQELKRMAKIEKYQKPCPTGSCGKVCPDVCQNGCKINTGTNCGCGMVGSRYAF